MKRILIVFLMVFLLSSCSDSAPEVECASDEIVVEGICQKQEPVCTSPEVLIDGVCKAPDPVCEDNETLVDGACIIVDPECNEGETLRDHQCIVIPDPVITLTGELEVTLEAGEEYIDLGAKAVYDGTEIDVVISGVPNTRETGTYTIEYTAVSSDGKSAQPVTRTLHIIDTTAPEISFHEYDDFIHEIDAPFTNEGIVVTDNSDNYQDIDIIVSGEIDISTLGDYELSYYAVDSSGNQSDTITKTVTVVEKETLSFTERYLKENTSLYDPNPYENSYTYDLIEWVHRGLIIENGEYKPVFYFFLHNEIDGEKVLKKIEFICPKNNQVYELSDDQIDYVFEMPLHCIEDGALGIITHAHDEYSPGQYWVAAMPIRNSHYSVANILASELKKGNLL